MRLSKAMVVVRRKGRTARSELERGPCIEKYPHLDLPRDGVGPQDPHIQ